MARERWIIVPNWRGPTGFQHYKDRDPKWIKVYRRLHSNDDFLGLSGHRRGVLLGIWIEYASSRGQLRVNTTTLSRRLNLRVTTPDLNALNHAGFIQFSASRPLAEPEQNDTDPLPRLDKKRKEKNLPLTSDGSEGPGKAKPIAHAKEAKTYGDPQLIDFAAMAERAMKAKAQLENGGAA